MFEEAFSIEKVWETHMSPISHLNAPHAVTTCHNDFQSKPSKNVSPNHLYILKWLQIMNL